MPGHREGLFHSHVEQEDVRCESREAIERVGCAGSRACQSQAARFAKRELQRFPIEPDVTGHDDTNGVVAIACLRLHAARPLVFFSVAPLAQATITYAVIAVN